MVKVAGITPGFQERQYTTAEVTLNYVVGPENGLPLLLIPGQMESWQGYKCVLPELSRRFHIFVPDLRGHGKSTRTPGRYSYNLCGNYLQVFIQQVIGRPTIVGGLSSGGVLAIWLAANAPALILAVIAEDPPIFSSVWPRIQTEKFLVHNFQVALDTLVGEPGKRDIERYFASLAAPVKGKTELLKIPGFIVAIISFLYRTNRALRPNSPYDPPFLPFYIRSAMNFVSEYDTDFSRATIDGDLSKDFSPQETLQKISCPMLLLRVEAYRHETWGIIGAIDDEDAARIVALVKDLKYVQIQGGHGIHIEQPARYIAEVTTFIDDLQTQGKLPVLNPQPV